MFCICNEMLPEINKNYENAANIYAKKRNDIMKQLEIQSVQADKEFIRLFQENYQNLLFSKYQSEATGREVKINTIITHLYNAITKMTESFIEQDDFSTLETEIEALKLETGNEIQKTKNVIDNLVKNYFEAHLLQDKVDELISKFLPNYISADNKALTAQQIYSYTQSLLKKQVLEKTSFSAIETTVRRVPAQILGYIREDMVADAALKLIEELKLKAEAKSVGANKSTIDILIAVGGASINNLSNADTLKDLLETLDDLNYSTTVEGESAYNTTQYLGIQSKPWDLSKPQSQWRRFSVGSRSSLLSEFLDIEKSSIASDIQRGWHRGVLFLSQHIPEVIGPNTVMYAIDGQIMWTDDLITNLYQTYHKYFAFVINEKTNELTKHIELADHYG